jgi:hypothetical protein
MQKIENETKRDGQDLNAMTIVKVFQYSAYGGRNEEVKILSGLIEENFPEFSSARFFWIDRTMIFGTLHSITALFIILIHRNVYI